MAIQQSTLDLIASFEGLVLHPYQDAGGVWTIGYGTTEINGTMVTATTPAITQAEAYQLLKTQLEVYATAVTNTIKVAIDQDKFDAMTSLCYNIGTSGFKESTVARECNAGNFPAAAQAFLLWDEVKGVINQGLLNRRKTESALFLK